MIDVGYRNPANFMLCVSKSGKPCPVCTSNEVALLFAPAQTPEIHQIVMERFGEENIGSPERIKEIARFIVLQTPLLATCGVCGHQERHNWHFIENPKVDAQGKVLRVGPPNALDDMGEEEPRR